LQKERLFIRDSENTLAAVVNEGEHLKIAGFAGGLNLEEAYRRVSGIEVDLESQLDFAVSLDKGYLTSDILNCGTGLRASALLHLPALEYSSLIDRAVKKVMEAGYEIKGLTGDEDRSLGALYELYNPVAIGESEKELLERLAHMSSQLVDYERRAREEMKRHRRLELEDIVYRAWGTLAHCRLLGEKESFKLLSDIRLGVGIGWLDFPIQRINQLMILTGKAHIQGMMGDEPSDELFRQTKYGRAKLVKYALGFASG
ncbi:MAG TPA: hypothetical protein ENN41_07385, partial [Sediminispirochaeta sp.]|nr:hypothetical protein [Sediminispirochaeta sp.]